MRACAHLKRRKLLRMRGARNKLSLRRTLVVTALGSLVAGCSFTTSQLNADPERYDGAMVVVRGFLRLGNGTATLYDSEVQPQDVQRTCDEGCIHRRARSTTHSCIKIGNPEVFTPASERLTARTVVLQGKFVVRHATASQGSCRSAGVLLIDEIALARRFPFVENQTAPPTSRRVQ